MAMVSYGFLAYSEAMGPEENIRRLIFQRSPFWVQIHGLLLRNLNSKFGMVIAGSLGKIIAVENPREKGKMANFLRVRVWVDVTSH